MRGSSRERAPALPGRRLRHDDLADEYLHHLAALVARLASHRDHAAIGPRLRWGRLHHLAEDLQHVAGTRGPRPADLRAGADDAARNRKSAVDQHAHRHRDRVPAARREALEDRGLRGLLVEVEGLRIVLAREFLDLVRADRVGAALEAPADAEVVEVEGRGPGRGGVPCPAFPRGRTCRIAVTASQAATPAAFAGSLTLSIPATRRASRSTST